MPRPKFTRPADIGQAVAFSAAAIDGQGWVLAMADSDDDCAVEFAMRVRSAAGRPDLPLRVVAAVREFESLFLAASGSLVLSGHFSARYPAAPTEVRDAAGAVRALMAGRRYKKTVHAAALTAALSLDEAESCRRFRKLGPQLPVGCGAR